MLKDSSNSMTSCLFLHRAANTDNPLICFHSNNIKALWCWHSLDVGKTIKKNQLFGGSTSLKRKIMLKAHCGPEAKYRN